MAHKPLKTTINTGSRRRIYKNIPTTRSLVPKNRLTVPSTLKDFHFMTSPFTAINPQRSATVSASAGTGKTWLLVSRIIRLLLAGAQPDTILAITFTRKAAAEMQTRLNERLLLLAGCNEPQLQEQLDIIGAAADRTTLTNARTLYETLLHNPHPPRITTFHAFCQDILRRFPFEANVPPGFELVEQTAELGSEAWDLLFTEATRQPDSQVAQALETLFDNCNGISNTLTTLQSFLNHRSDWWAYTLEHNDPVAFAISALQHQLQITDKTDPAVTFFTTDTRAQLREFAGLLARNANRTNTKFLDLMGDAERLVTDGAAIAAFDRVSEVFLTAKGEPRKRQSSKTQINKMGPAGDTRFVQLHEMFCDRLLQIAEQRARLKTFKLSRAWYIAGNQLLAHYTHIKQERRLLDFADLEWNAYLLLNDQPNALWVQYKLDARINHILIDEFQDTNPTQWQLLLPLLEELAAQHAMPHSTPHKAPNPERQRSVFLVGDSKQSIYRFRRAQPRLFDIAQHWLAERLDATNAVLDTSRRSSPAIMEFVNAVFGDGILHERIVHFDPHKTHLTQLWGRIEVLPLFEGTEPTTSDDGQPDASAPLRNPLLDPRVLDEDERRALEAGFIADKIGELMTANTIIGEKESARPLRHDDIIILLRHRTHAATYEHALMQAGIPYIGIDKGTLLETLETRDMMALLETLITPFNSLALAQVLKSPLFDFTDEELIELAACQGGHWLQRLKQLSHSHPANKRLNRAVRMLENWKSLMGKLPVHDLLDKIYSDSNLIARYVAAYPPHLQHRVVANLNRFIELALEIDSGRYPSVGRFLYRLQTMRTSEQDAPDQTPAGTSDARVRLLTIHAAKGLEAPVIFLADAANTVTAKDAYRAIVQWPAEHRQPQHFFMANRKAERDDWTREILTRQESAIEREEANLLYVAVTRAKQLLFVTGTPSKQRQDQGWYAQIASQLRTREEFAGPARDKGFVLQMGTMAQPPPTATSASPSLSVVVDPGLSRPIELPPGPMAIAPSLVRNDDLPPGAAPWSGTLPTADEDLQQRGVIIHKLLQWLAEGRPHEYIRQHILALAGGDPLPRATLDQYWREADQVINHAEFRYLFDPARFRFARNEVPISYPYHGNVIHGIVDRLVVSDNDVFVVDYKTHTNTDPHYQRRLVGHYQIQMSLYEAGIKRLWPDKTISAQLLFTHNTMIADAGVIDIDKLQLPGPTPSAGRPN